MLAFALGVRMSGHILPFQRPTMEATHYSCVSDQPASPHAFRPGE